MSRAMTALIGFICVLVLLSGVTKAETLYTNDFGTTEQFDGLIWTGDPDLLSLIRGGAGSGQADLDGDTLTESVIMNGASANASGVKVIYAPPFQTMSNISMTGWARGSSTTYQTGGQIMLSDNGIVDDYIAGSDDSNTWAQYSTSSGINPFYTNINVVYAKAYVYCDSATYDPSYSGRVSAIQIDADVADGEPGDRVNLTRNDFGTTAQQEAWTLDSEDMVTFVSNPDVDHDMDDLASEARFVWGNGNYFYMSLRIDAPAGYVFKDPVATAQGYGAWNNQGTCTALALSLPGEPWNDVVSSYPPAAMGWYDMTADATGLPEYQNLSTVYVWVRLLAWNNGYLPRFKDLVVTAELVGPELPENAIYANDFGTVEQRSVGGSGEWDSSVTLSGTPDLVYYDGGVNGISVDWDDDGAHGGLSASGEMGVRYIKRFELTDGRTYRDIIVTANGHADPSVDASFGVGLSVDGTNWIQTDSVSESWTDYPDRQAIVDASADPNFIDATEFYVMVEWDNGTDVSDPCLAAYITDVIVEATVKNPPIEMDGSMMGFYGSSGEYDFDISLKLLVLNSTYLSTSTLETRQTFWDEVEYAYIGNRPQLVIIRFDAADTVEDMKDKLDVLLGNDGGVVTYYTDMIGICFGEEQTPMTQTGVVVTDDIHNELYDYVKANWPSVQVYRWYSYNIRPLSFDAGVAEKCDGYIWDDYYTTDTDTARLAVMSYAVTGKQFLNILWACEPNWNESGYFMSDWLDGVPAENQNYLVTASPNSATEQYWDMYSDVLREFGLPVGVFGVVGSEASYNSWIYQNVSPNHTYVRDEIVYRVRHEMWQTDGSPAATADYSASSGMEVDVTSYSYTDDYKTNGTNLGLGTLYEASIYGFLSLVQSTASNGELVTRSETHGQVELVYRFYATSGGIDSPSASLTGLVDPAQGGVNTVGLSLNGRDMTDWVSSTPGVATSEVLSVTGGSAYQDREAVYVHVIMSYNSSAKDSPANTISNLNVTATLDGSATPLPDEGQCGLWGYLPSDIAGPFGLIPDCIVDLRDFAAIAGQWNECTDPTNSNCD